MAYIPQPTIVIDTTAGAVAVTVGSNTVNTTILNFPTIQKITGNITGNVIVSGDVTGNVTINSPPGLPVLKVLSSNNNINGTVNLIGNYNSGPTDFYYRPSNNQVFLLQTLSIQLSDTTSIVQSDYGTITNGLANGIAFYISSNTVGELPLLSGFKIKQNMDFYTLTTRILQSQFSGQGQTLSITFDLADFGTPLIVDGRDYGTIKIRLNDNFTSLLAHKFIARGRLVSY